MQYKEEAKKLFTFFYDLDNGYYAQHAGKLFEVNVKVYGLSRLSEEDTKDVLNRIKAPTRHHKALIEYLESKEQEHFDMYLEQECYWVTDMFFIKGEAIDDEEIIKNFSIIKDDSYGFYGRQGGHFCFDILGREAIIHDLEDIITGGLTPLESKAIIETAEDMKAKVLFIKNWIKEAHKRTCDIESYKDFLVNQLDDQLTELMETEKARNTPSITSLTLATLLESPDTTISRHANGILKALKNQKQ